MTTTLILSNSETVYSVSWWRSGTSQPLTPTPNHRNILQVPIQLLMIQPKPGHKPVRDLKAAKIDWHLYQAARSAVEQRAESQRIWPASGQVLEQIARGEPGVDDVLHQHHVFALDAVIQVLRDSHQAWPTSLVGETRDGEE